METKKCNVCMEIKSLDQFYNRKDTPDGKQYKCKDCKKSYHSDYKKINGDRIRAYGREQRKRYYKENKTTCRSAADRYRARKRKASIGFAPPDIKNILSEWFGPLCAYPGCSNHGDTLDHVMPLSRGGAHDISNFQLLCKSHNSSKSTNHIDFRPFVLTEDYINLIGGCQAG